MVIIAYSYHQNFTYSSPACQFFVQTNGVCFLGNVFTNQSILAARSDNQTVNIFQGTALAFLAG